jgi:hypothetical protein
MWMEARMNAAQVRGRTIDLGGKSLKTFADGRIGEVESALRDADDNGCRMSSIDIGPGVVRPFFNAAKKDSNRGVSTFGAGVYRAISSQGKPSAIPVRAMPSVPQNAIYFVGYSKRPANEREILSAIINIGV